MKDDDGIKQIGRNKFHVRVKRIDQRTGRQRNRKLTIVGTKQDALRARDSLRNDLASATKTQRMRLSAYATSWLEQREARGLKPSTLRRYGYSLEHIVPALGDYYLDALNPADVRAYVAARIAKGAAGYTVLNELRTLRTMAKDSVADGYAAIDWAARVPAPKVSRYTKERPNLLDAKQFVALGRKIPKQWRGLALFMATTGLRWGEASALHWQFVDWSTRSATIQLSNDRGKLVDPKTESSLRSVPVLPEVAKLWGLRKKTGLVFPTKLGRLHRGYPLLKVLRLACEAANVPRVTAHGLRRTFNNLARQKVSREVLKSITGHVTDTMVEHYSFVAPGEKLRGSRAVAKSLGIVGVPKVSRSRSRK